MRALLDTNVIIHRENTKATSFTIGKLFYWLDKLHYEKLIHPYSIDELRKYRNPQMQSLYDAKIDALPAERRGLHYLELALRLMKPFIRNRPGS